MKKIIKFMTLLTLLTLGVVAKTIEVDYKVEFGIIGEIGIANAKLIQNENNNTYEIDIQLKATGIAKTLSGGREERHISKGYIKDGVMISELYQVIKRHGSKVSNKIYRIDHDKKEVTREKKRWKKGKLVKDETKVMEKAYAKDDLLTLYFNLEQYIDNKTVSKKYRFHAVGAEIQDGYVDVYIPKESELDDYKKMLGKNASWYAKAIIYQKIFSSKKGELMLGIGDNGVVQKALLKDVIFFGDIRAKKI